MPRKNSFHALITLSENTLQFPLKGLMQLLLNDRLRPVMEHAPLHDKSDFPYGYEGGMVDYIIDTFEAAKRLRNGLNWSGSDTSDHSILVACMLHPLGILMDFNGAPYYVPNLLLDKKPSAKRPWKKNPALNENVFTDQNPKSRLARMLLNPNEDLIIPKGLRALGIMAAQFPALVHHTTDAEKHAIRFAFGPYETGESARLINRETRLQQLVATARIVVTQNL
jgi:hypothetical protein